MIALEAARLDEPQRRAEKPQGPRRTAPGSPELQGHGSAAIDLTGIPPVDATGGAPEQLLGRLGSGTAYCPKDALKECQTCSRIFP